ncbi:hypothetical protein Vadar_019399 [Vaccinium darrowii]|uniref:Uncharacterized protein n=1 Tax=Vaccinium darrowii TaxID=229202 RepID=A0ACB7XRX5_9ERIC|nr:hypothetical protein Vadar_019399 [Vaccinium darrowii]
MSSFNLAKKLTPAKKAWMSFTKKLQSKFHKHNISASIKKTTRGLKSLSSIRRLLIPRALTRHRYPLDHHRQHSGHHYLHKNMAAIYVDELFPGEVNNTSHAKKIYQDEGKTSKAKEIGTSGGKDENMAKGKKARLVAQWQDIDQRAEEFISKFREDMKLQREKSLGDFYEMLARSC